MSTLSEIKVEVDLETLGVLAVAAKGWLDLLLISNRTMNTSIPWDLFIEVRKLVDETGVVLRAHGVVSDVLGTDRGTESQ